jgi:hypothetical protein
MDPRVPEELCVRETSSMDKVVASRGELLQYHSSNVHWDEAIKGIVWLWCSIFCGFGVWGEQSSQCQRLVAGNLGHLESHEGEFADHLESTKYVCR